MGLNSWSSLPKEFHNVSLCINKLYHVSPAVRTEGGLRELFRLIHNVFRHLEEFGFIEAIAPGDEARIHPGVLRGLHIDDAIADAEAILGAQSRDLEDSDDEDR